MRHYDVFIRMVNRGGVLLLGAYHTWHRQAETAFRPHRGLSKGYTPDKR